MGEEVKKKLTPTIRCFEQHLMVGHIACSTIGKIICGKIINPNHCCSKMHNL